MAGLFGNMFDMNHDGKMSGFERAMEFHFMEEMLRNEHIGGASEYEDDDDEDEEEEYEEESRTNAGLVIVLIILIVLLLLASGFFFLKYLLPNMTEKSVETEPVVMTEALETEAPETTELIIPCSNLMMDGGKMELGKDGKKLLNVHVYPEDTTDILAYVSADENIVTVSEDGTVTAVGEGQTIITISCGAQQITCNVTVDFAEADATVPEGELPAPQVESTEATEAAEDTAETTEATEKAEATSQPLKLKKDDITISANYTSVQLELEGDVDPADLKWFTMDSTVAICHGGLVTATGSGLTKVYGEYNGEQVMCIIRCIF